MFIKGNWDISTFFAAYITLPIFFIFWAGWKIAKRTKVVPLDQIDFMSGRREFDEQEAVDVETFKPDTWYTKVSSILF